MKKSWIISLLFIGVCFILVAQGLAFYQWTDENGVVHYGDAPPDTVENIMETPEGGSVPAPGQEEKTMPEKTEPVFPEKEQNFQMPVDIKEFIDTFTLAPHTKKEISFVAFEPVKIGFKTDITPETVAKCKNSGAGIKDKYSGIESISPYGGSCEFKPKDGYIKFYVGNLEDFPINIIVFKY